MGSADFAKPTVCAIGGLREGSATLRTTQNVTPPRPQRHRPGMKPKQVPPVEPAVPAPQTVTVHLGGPLQSAAGGETVFEVEATNIMTMLDALGEKYPKLKPILAKSVTVVLDGHVYRGAWLQPVKAGSEIYLLPPLSGG